MNRTEFLAALALRLEDLPVDEREEAVKYYSEYLDEVGPSGEDSAIDELGGAEKVSNIIRANCGLGPFRPAAKAVATPELTLDSPSYSQAVENTVRTSSAAAQAAQASAAAHSNASASTQTASNPTAVNLADNASAAPKAVPLSPPVYTSASGNPFAGQAPDARNVYNAAGTAEQRTTDAPAPLTYSSDGQTTPPTYSAGGQQSQYNNRNNRILWILLIAASSPIWLGLVGGFIGLVVGILGMLMGLIGSGFAVLFAGIAHAVVSISLFASSPATALATIGMSLLGAGLGALLGGCTLLACSKLFPFLFNTIGSCFGWLRRKVSGRNV